MLLYYQVVDIMRIGLMSINNSHLEAMSVDAVTCMEVRLMHTVLSRGKKWYRFLFLSRTYN